MKSILKRNLLHIIIIFSIFTLNIFPINILANSIGGQNIDLVVLFKNNTTNEDVKNIICSSGGKISDEFLELGEIKVECSPDLIPIIESQESVESISLNRTIKLAAEETKKAIDLENYDDDLYWNYQWDIKRVTNNNESFNLESGNHDVIVGIIDSGVNINHPDLIENFLGGKNLVPKGFGHDSSETGDPDDVNDRLGHGTSVAGVIAANGKIKGVAPNIGFKSYRVFNKFGETNANICASAIIEATNDGVKVINLSISSYYSKGQCYGIDKNAGVKYNIDSEITDYLLMQRAIEYAIKNGVTVVSSAGNDNLDCSNAIELTKNINERYKIYGLKYIGLTYESPGNIEGVITVSSTKKDDKLASYSNYGENFIDISAPGGDVSEEYDVKNMCLTADIDSGYALESGTSIAAPKVSAIVGLLICKNPNNTPKLIEEKLYKTADKLQENNFSKYYGNGIVNAYKALK